MKKVKYLIIILAIVFITGCTNINKTDYKKLINDIGQGMRLTNTSRKGYKYYVPKGIKIINVKDYNEILRDDNYTYYLYVDVVSFYNGVKCEYIENKNAYYSLKLDNGYLEINKLENDKYLIEIMDNYAKIEVIVDGNYLKKAVTFSEIILSSIEYKYNVLDSLMKEEMLNSSEIEFDIFKTISSDASFSVYEEEYNQYEETVKDSDMIE